MKSYEEIMEILEAFDLTGSFRAAAELAGCSHHTVERYVHTFPVRKRRRRSEKSTSITSHPVRFALHQYHAQKSTLGSPVSPTRADDLSISPGRY